MTLNEIQANCLLTAHYARVKIVDENGELVEKNFGDLTNLEKTQNRPNIVDQLANAYCQAEEDQDELNKDKNWAAILSLYWYMIFEWMGNSSSLGLRPTDYFDWLNDAIGDAFWYRSWRTKRWEWVRKDEEGNKLEQPYRRLIDNPQYRPEEINAVDKSIHYFLKAKRGKEYQDANKDKRKSNYGSVLSIDTTFDEDGYSILDRNEGLSTAANVYNPVAELVNIFLKMDKPIEAIIIDAIANGESIKENLHKKDITYKEVNEDGVEEEYTETYKSYSHEFDKRKLVKYLNSLDDNYFVYHFTKLYKVEDYKPMLTKLKSLNNGKLYRAIETTLQIIRGSKDMREVITAGASFSK